MLIAVTIGLSVNSVKIILAGGIRVNEAEISIFQLIVGTIALLVFLVLGHFNKCISSPTANAELLGWKMDAFSGFGMSFAFYGATYLELTPFAFLAPYFDQLISLLIALIMIPSFVKMIIVSVKDVFLFAPEQEIMDFVKDTSYAILEEYNFARPSSSDTKSSS